MSICPRHRSFLSVIVIAVLLIPAQSPAEEDAELVKKVNEAVEKGVKWLKAQQQADGSFPQPTTGTTLGSTAISLYALLKVGVPRNDPAIVNGFKFMREQKHNLYKPPVTVFPVYTVSFLIMALAASGEATEVKETEGTQVVTNEAKVNLDKGDLAWLKELHQWLLSVRVDYKGKKGTCTAWGYRGENQNKPMLSYADNSNTQIAVLALKAASLCGIKTTKEIWKQTLAHFLEQQEENGEKVERVGMTPEGKTGTTGVEDMARGWSYKAGEKSRITMVAAGVGSVLVCLSELGSVANQAECDKAVRDGIAKLAKEYDKPDYVIGGPYYFLYGAERVGMIAGVKNIGEHLWWEEGAAMLLDKQNDDGSWSELRASGGSGPGAPGGGGPGAPGGAPGCGPGGAPGGGPGGGGPGGGPGGGGGGGFGNSSGMTVINTSLALLFLKKGTFKIKGKKYQDIIETGKGADK